MLTNLEQLQKKNPDLEMVIKGAYEYTYKEQIYCEENFHFYKNVKESTFTYQSESLSRLESGEFFKVECVYVLNKDYYPIRTIINKYVGSSHILESYIPDQTKTNITYKYSLNKKVEKSVIQVPPKYNIATSHTCNSFVFLMQKKYDPTGRNFHNVLVSENLWEFIETPKMSYVIIIRQGNGTSDYSIKGKKLKSTVYEIYSSEDYEKLGEKPMMVYISKHYTIPYAIIIDEDTKIEIKYLNELDKPKIDELY